MFVSSVIDQETGIEYTIDTDQFALGEGGTAKVWEGINRQDPSKSVAIKIAHRGTPAALLEEFWGELSTLNTLFQTQAKHNIPWAHQGESPEAPDADIIVMELIPDEWQLTRQALQADGKLPEKLALAAGLQYARLLMALHSKGITTRGDRKATDMRWDSHQQRLIVLDWNRAKPIPPIKDEDETKTSSFREELIRQDLRGFGQLWSELVLGRRVTALPLVDDESDAEWVTLTRGFRDILSRSLGSRAAWGYQKAEDLALALEEHKRRLESASKDSIGIIQEAESLRDKTIQVLDPGGKSKLAHQVLTLVNLVSDDLTNYPQIEALKSWAREQLSIVMEKTFEAIERIRGKLSLQDYESAAQIADEAVNRLKGQEIDLRQASLRLTRWLLVARAGVRGNELRRDMRAPVHSLQDCVLKIEEAAYVKTSTSVADVTLALSSAQNALQETENNIPDGIRGILQPLRLEIHIRGNLATAIKMDNERRTDEARGWYDKALAMWKELEKSDMLYAENLRAGLDVLDRKLSPETLETTLGEELRQKRDGFERALHDLIGKLQADGRGEWRDLASELTTVRQHYQGIRSLLPEPTGSDLASYEFVSWLSDVNDCMVRNDVPSVLARAQQMPSSSIPEEYKSITLSRCQYVAVYKARRLLKKEWTWPDELERAQSIIATVKDSSPLPPEIERHIPGIEQDLREWVMSLDN